MNRRRAIARTGDRSPSFPRRGRNRWGEAYGAVALVALLLAVSVPLGGSGSGGGRARPGAPALSVGASEAAPIGRSLPAPLGVPSISDACAQFAAAPGGGAGCGPGRPFDPHPAFGPNSTPVPEPGTRVAAISVGSDPQGIAFDPANGFLYVANQQDDSVSVINSSVVVAVVSVGTDPQGVAFEPHTGYVYVTNNGAGTVSLINGTTVVGTVDVGSNPTGIAVDPGSGLVYVAEISNAAVTVLSGSTNLSTIKVGSSPDGVAYDSSNGDIYVSNNGADSVTVINGTSVVKTISVGSSPEGIAYAPNVDLVYVADANGHNVTTLNGLNVGTNLPVGSGPDGVAYDGANGDVYVANQGSHNVSVLDGITVVGAIGVGAYPTGVAYSPLNGGIYVTCSTPADVEVISTLLAEASASISDNGHAVTTSDAEQILNVSATLWGLGSTGFTASYFVAPSPGFGCSGPLSLNITNLVGLLSVDCIPVTPGIYTIWLNVTDSLGGRAWSYVNLAVDPALLVPAPSVSAVFLAGRATADVGQAVGFTISPSGGSGVYTTFRWVGLPVSNCTGLGTSRVSCRFPTPGSYQVFVGVNDSNLASASGPPAVVIIDPAPVARAPVANRTSADVDQSVRFTESPMGGPGTYASFSWAISPSGGCSGSTTANLVCSFGSSGPRNVSVVLVDAVGGVAASPVTSFRVFDLPTIALPTANRTFADVGQPISFGTSAAGGAGNLTFSWSGLPSNCFEVATAAPHCTLTDPGVLAVWPTVTDGNGGSVPATSVVSVTVYPDPAAGAPTFSSGSVAAGSSVKISTLVTGGSGTYQYVWFGLPPGCRGVTGSLTCSPSSAGSYPIYVTVTDSAGLSNTSAVSVLTVQSNGATTAVAVVVVVVVVLGVVAAVVVLVRRRRRARPPRAAAVPEPESLYPSGPAEEELPPEGSEAIDPGDEPVPPGESDGL